MFPPSLVSEFSRSGRASVQTSPSATTPVNFGRMLDSIREAQTLDQLATRRTELRSARDNAGISLDEYASAKQALRQREEPLQELADKVKAKRFELKILKPYKHTNTRRELRADIERLLGEYHDTRNMTREQLESACKRLTAAVRTAADAYMRHVEQFVPGILYIP